MKSIAILVVVLFVSFLTSPLVAQTPPWQVAGNDIYYNTGNVGIGTSAPTEKLDVNGAIRGRNVIWWGNGIGVLGYQVNKKVLINGNTGYGLSLGANNQNDRLNIATNGYVGVGLVNPDREFHVKGNAKVERDGGVELVLKANDNSISRPATTAAFRIEGFGGRGKGIFITDGTYDNEWFIGEGYDYEGIGIGYTTKSQSQSEYYQHAKLYVKKDGKVGIGTTSPAEKLDVNGVIQSRNIIRWGTNAGLLGYQVNNKAIIRGGAGYGLSLGAGNQDDHLFINTTGKVGIGTTTFPTSDNYKLAVAGKVICTKVKVQEQANWSDYVFAADYDLMPLAELANYISTHHHLPNIPSAEEVARDGFFLGDMDAKLLEKIEELTLHMIEKEKKVQQLNDKVEKLENLVEQLLEASKK